MNNISDSGITELQFIGIYNFREDYNIDKYSYLGYGNRIEKNTNGKLEIYTNKDEKYKGDKLYYKRIGAVGFIKFLLMNTKNILEYSKEKIELSDRRLEDKVIEIKKIKEEFINGN